jgi:hypothetical protein
MLQNSVIPFLEKIINNGDLPRKTSPIVMNAQKTIILFITFASSKLKHHDQKETSVLKRPQTR